MKPLDEPDWTRIASTLDIDGGTVIPGLLDAAECTALSGIFDEATHFGAKLPPALHALRSALYERLVPIANRWSRTMAGDEPYPGRLDDFLEACRRVGQTRPQSAMSRLREGGHVALHQQAEGKFAFPLQVEILLSEPGRDFEGGELVVTERRPRMQSRPMVLPLRRGDAAIFAGHERPVRGSNGFYRVRMKHGVSRLRRGQRCAVSLLFHDAPDVPERAGADRPDSERLLQKV